MPGQATELDAKVLSEVDDYCRGALLWKARLLNDHAEPMAGCQNAAAARAL